MEFEWDEAKRRSNLDKHGVDFADLDEFDWSQAVVIPSARCDYGEDRFVAIGEFRDRFHTVVVTWRRAKLRIISFRKARIQEVRRYEAEKEKQSRQL